MAASDLTDFSSEDVNLGNYPSTFESAAAAMKRSATKASAYEYVGEDAVTLTPEDSEDMVRASGYTKMQADFGSELT